MHSIGTPLLFRFIFCMEITCADRCAGSCVHWAAWNYLHSFFACIELSWEKTCALRALAGNLRDNYRQIRKHICAQRAECMWRSKWRYILHFHYKVSLWILVIDRCRVVLRWPLKWYMFPSLRLGRWETASLRSSYTDSVMIPLGFLLVHSLLHVWPWFDSTAYLSFFKRSRSASSNLHRQIWQKKRKEADSWTARESIRAIWIQQCNLTVSIFLKLINRM